MKLQKGDKVKIIAGKYKNETGMIKYIDAKKQRIFFENLIKLKKHTKPDNINPDGGINEIPGSIHISNVMLLSPKSKSKKMIATRIGYKIINKKKTRIAKKTGKVIVNNG